MGVARASRDSSLLQSLKSYTSRLMGALCQRYGLTNGADGEEQKENLHGQYNYVRRACIHYTDSIPDLQTPANTMVSKWLIALFSIARILVQTTARAQAFACIEQLDGLDPSRVQPGQRAMWLTMRTYILKGRHSKKQLSQRSSGQRGAPLTMLQNSTITALVRA